MSLFKRALKGSVPPAGDWERDTERNIEEIQDTLAELLNNGLRFEDNFNCVKKSITTSAVIGTASTIAHGLKRVPIGYSIIRKDKAAHIFESAAPDSTNVYLKSDVASVTATILVF